MTTILQTKQGIPPRMVAMKTGQHIVFWLVAYLFFILFFGRANRDYPTTIIFASMLFPLAIITGYFLNYFLIPRYLYKGKYWQFALFIGYTLVISMWFETMISLFIFIIVNDYEFYKLDPASFDVVFLLVGLYFIIIGFIAIEQVKRAFEMKKENTRLEKDQLETNLKLREAELKLLKAQIHPHFLFNTLNNLYGLTLEKSDLAPQLVLRLSDLMDYMLYKCQGSQVDLKNEIEHIRNYIEIERIRYAKKLKLDFKFSGKLNNQPIAPMLLLPFVENAFKHGVSKQIENPFVKIDIVIQNTDLQVTVENSKNKNAVFAEDYTKGIGLQNVKKRLVLLYPEKHKLEIISGETDFKINLYLDLGN